MHFSLNTNMYRMAKPFLFYKHTYDMNEDVFRYYRIVLCELTINFYFKKSAYYEVLLMNM